MRITRRATRYALKKHQRRITESRSSSLCGTARAGGVNVDVGAALTAHIGGVHRCGSSWSCPVCAPVIRQRRAVEIDAGCSAHLSAGGGIEFATFTARHHQGDALTDRLAVMAQGLRHLLKGSGWTRRRDRLGYVGSIRAVEVTWGNANGWHPHLHVLLFFSRPLTDAERADLTAWLFSRWSAHLLNLGLGSITRANGIDVRSVTTQEGLGEYLTAVEGGWTAGLELARSDAKRSTPFGLLERLVDTGEVRWFALWREYEAATFGRTSIAFSPGLRGRLGLDVVVLSDAELAASEGLDLALFRALYQSQRWNQLHGRGVIAQVLQQVEEVAAVLLHCCAVMGVNPQPLDVPRGGDDDGQEVPEAPRVPALRTTDRAG